MSPIFGNKNQCFTFYTPRDIEFLQIKNDKSYGELCKAAKRHINDPSGKSLIELFPEDTRQGINRNPGNYHDLSMIYKNPDAKPGEREFQDNVCVYRTEPSPIAGYNMVQVPRHRKKDAKIVKETLESMNPPIKDAKSGRIISGAYQDVNYSLSLEEVPDNDDEDDSQLVRDPKPVKTAQASSKK